MTFKIYLCRIHHQWVIFLSAHFLRLGNTAPPKDSLAVQEETSSFVFSCQTLFVT
jgi:hypothetical protein